jgi:hypothetical protein
MVHIQSKLYNNNILIKVDGHLKKFPIDNSFLVSKIH